MITHGIRETPRRPGEWPCFFPSARPKKSSIRQRCCSTSIGSRRTSPTRRPLCRQHGVAWRPHAKGHKSPDIARRLIEAGAIGLTCAKLGEAEVFAAAGIPDLLIANFLAGQRKIERLVELRQKADPIICLDSIDQAVPISAAMHAAGQRVRAILEVDIGLERAGVCRARPAVELAKRVADLPGNRVGRRHGLRRAICCTVEDQGEKAARISPPSASLSKRPSEFTPPVSPAPIVSCGGTGSLPFAVASRALPKCKPAA